MGMPVKSAVWLRTTRDPVTRGSGCEPFRRIASRRRNRLLAHLLAIACAGAVPGVVARSATDPPAPAASRPVAGFKAQAVDEFVTELTWDDVDGSANGIVVERCWPQRTGPNCELAAALHSDVRVFSYHAVQPWRFRVASFNAHGVSAFSPLSPVKGAAHVFDTRDPPPLSASDSLVARRVAKITEQFGRCTSPQALIDEGLDLIAVREGVDLFRGPQGECGTGGCPYATYTVKDGCYEALERDLGLYTSSPYIGRPDDRGTGLRVTGSSSRACEGTVVIFSGDSQVDSYEWFSCYDEHLQGLRVPFNTRGLQIPDVWQDRDVCVQSRTEVHNRALSVETCLVGEIGADGSAVGRTIVQTPLNVSDQPIELELYENPVDQFQIAIYAGTRVVGKPMNPVVPDCSTCPQHSFYFRTLAPGESMQLEYPISEFLLEPVDEKLLYTLAINTRFPFRYLHEPKGQAYALRRKEARERNEVRGTDWFRDIRFHRSSDD